MGLYEKIKYLSNSKKLSIRQLEEKLDYGNGTIRRWETSKPSIDKVQKVADYFDVSVDYLLGRTDNPSPPENKTDDYEDELLMMFRRGESEVPEEKKELYRKQVTDLMGFISKTMKDLDEENK